MFYSWPGANSGDFAILNMTSSNAAPKALAHPDKEDDDGARFRGTVGLGERPGQRL